MLQTAHLCGNPNGMHEESRHASMVIERARDQVAKLVSAKPNEIFFFPSASLANYFLVTSFKHVLTSPFEHPSILKAIEGVTSAQPELTSHLIASNETGEIYDVERFFARHPDAKKHSDMSQAVGKIPINLGALSRDIGLDFATISSQKIGGGKGAAALYARQGKLPLSLIKKLFALGTPNASAIASSGAAAEKAYSTVVRFESKIKPLRDQLRSRIQSDISNVVINTPSNSLPNTLNVSFPGAEGESIMLLLDHSGVAVSTGSACTTSDSAPSHVLMSLYKDLSRDQAAEIAHSSIRFSFPPDAPADSVDRIMHVLPDIITKLRGIS